jgi:ArsR family transcriptional regulator
MPTDVTFTRGLPVPLAPPGLPGAALVLRMLADPVRAAILDLLATEQLCVCHLQEALGAKQTLVSHHLKALRDAGLVEAEPAGRYVYYRLVPGAFDEVRDAVTALAVAGGRDLPRRPC